MGAPARDVRRRQTAANLSVAILVVSVCCCCCEGLCHGMERRALLELKHSINYPNGSALPTWVGTQAGDEDCCQWRGVSCDNSSGRVIAINLTGERTTEAGTWYPNLTMLAHLRKLETLDLSDNQMGGWAFAPALCNLRRLRELDLSSNSLEGIPPPEYDFCVCQMRALARLDFHGNGIQGSFPPCLCNVSSLATLSAYSNRLQGKIPPCLGNLHSLEVLKLHHNQFVGDIPPSIFHNLTNLRQLGLGGDQLAGMLDLSVSANLSKLEYFVLTSGGGLEITESSSWVPSFQLQFMGIERCTVNKHSGYEVPRFLSTQHSLTDLILVNCSLTGRLPPWLFFNSSLHNLFLEGNQFHGMFPQPYLNLSSAIEVLDISSNKIYGSLPSNIDSLFPLLTHLIMNGNYMEGQTPPSLGRVPLRLLDFSDNSLSGGLPLDLTRNATMLEWLDLSHNHLEGEMLPRDCHMPSLKFLFLSGNSFTGPISPRISNSSLLEVLDVGGNDMRCDLSNCLPVLGGGVLVLLLGENFFEGHLPKHLCAMPHLQLFDISKNNLSGKIPTCFNNVSSWKTNIQGLSTFEATASFAKFPVVVSFTSKYNRRAYQGGPLPLLRGLDLSSNMLDGNIPPELGGLKQLQILNLSHNHLWGSIPASFGNLLSTESLDLSYNYLTGTIPHELARLHFLATFSVAFNDLSGAIPFDGQFSSFNASSYEGNAGLCGLPLEQNCSTKNTEQPVQLEHTEDGEIHGLFDSDKIFYSFLALSYVVGFWCFMATIILSKRWRVQYFRAIDGYYDLRLSRFVK